MRRFDKYVSLELKKKEFIDYGSSIRKCQIGIGFDNDVLYKSTFQCMYVCMYCAYVCSSPPFQTSILPAFPFAPISRSQDQVETMKSQHYANHQFTRMERGISTDVRHMSFSKYLINLVRIYRKIILSFTFLLQLMCC